jgi:glycosyltransferase involved in cell wall biosynthesis
VPTVLHCIPGLGGGGGERQLAYLAGPLRRLGWDVHVVFGAAGPNLPRLRDGGAVLHRIHARSNHDPRLAWQLARVFRTVRPDIVQVWFVQMEVLGGGVAGLFGVPWVLAERSCPPGSPLTWKHRARNVIARMADAIVANSEGGDAYWRGFSSARTIRRIIPNAVPRDEIDAALPADPPGIVLQPREKFVLVAARFEQEKNIDAVFAAMCEVVKRPGIAAVLCGDGPERPRLQRAIRHAGLAHRIAAPGYVENLWSVMKRAAVVVSAGLFEGRPNIVLEAMACGRPLVVSEIPAHREILDDRTAMWVNPADPCSIAAGVNAVIDDPEGADRRAAAARPQTSSLTPEASAAMYSELYRDLLRAPRRHAAAGLAIGTPRNGRAT